mgnify:CR=1 FL=1
MWEEEWITTPAFGHPSTEGNSKQKARVKNEKKRYAAAGDYKSCLCRLISAFSQGTARWDLKKWANAIRPYNPAKERWAGFVHILRIGRSLYTAN